MFVVQESIIIIIIIIDDEIKTLKILRPIYDIVDYNLCLSHRF